MLLYCVINTFKNKKDQLFFIDFCLVEGDSPEEKNIQE